MSCGLNWEPWLRAQHIGFIRQSSCLSWGGKACQNLHRHLQSFVFYSLCSPRVPTCHRWAVLGSWDCAQRDPLSVSSSLRPAVQALLWEELVFSGECHCGWHTHFSVCLSSGEAATTSCLPNNQRILSVGCYGETCCQSQTGQIKGLSCLLVSKQSHSSAEFTGQTLLLFCAICFSLSNIWPQKKVPVFLTNPRQVKDAVILQWAPS